MRIVALISFLICVVWSLPARADDYTYRDGFYWSGGNAFTRTLVSSPVSYSYYNGCYHQYPSTSYYTYAQVPVATAYKTPEVKVPKYSADWKTEVVKAAEQRDDIAAFNKAMAALFPNYNGTNYAHAEAYSSGQTVYGYTPYSYQTVKEAYGQLDINQLYQAAARLASSAQQFGSQATSEHAGLVQSAGDQFARVEEIRAKAQAVAAFARSIDAQPSTKTTTTVNGLTPTPVTVQSNYVQQSTAQDDTAAFVANVIGPNCSRCHSGASAKAHLDLTQWAALSATQKDSILQRVLSNDATKRMPPPKNADGTANPLTPNDLGQILIHLKG